MKTTSWQRWIVAAGLSAATALLMLGAAGCSSSNSGGCNACPQIEAPITADECQAAAKAANCASAELVQVSGNGGGPAACGKGVPYQACNWIDCHGKVNACPVTAP
jgi:hypothetical protein